MSQPPPRCLVVMGVAGCGKSTVAALLAQRLGWAFAEGDALHPAANITKMRSGIPLDDADRQPWLEAVRRVMEAWRTAGIAGVITCSALRRAYREVLAADHADVCFVYLRGSRTLIAQRLAERRGHFMPASLLDSQFAVLEEPLPPERAVIVELGAAPEALVDNIIAAIGGMA